MHKVRVNSIGTRLLYFAPLLHPHSGWIVPPFCNGSSLSSTHLSFDLEVKRKRLGREKGLCFCLERQRSVVSVSKPRAHICLYFCPHDHRACYHTNCFNLSSRLNNAIVSFVHLLIVPIGKSKVLPSHE